MSDPHRHAIEQASSRWRGGRREDPARTRRKILISTQVTGEPGGVVERKGVSGWVGGLARGAPTTNKARTQFAVRADVKDGDVYLDLGSPVFSKATKPSSSSLMQGD